jgi:itaconyl-CoA hydratase
MTATEVTTADLAEFPLAAKGNFFESFGVGDKFSHHWGKTMTDTDATLFNSLTLNYSPIFNNVEFAKAFGNPSLPLNPYLVFLTVLGLSVEDTSEKDGGMFLSVAYTRFLASVYVGDTLTASSEVVAVRDSRSRPTNGIVTWRTQGHNQRGELVLELERTNLVARQATSE